jgi:hypothetical protein
MNILKDFKLKWWQVGLFKLALLSLGIIIGVYFADLFSGNILLLWILFLVPGIYLSYVWFKQAS